METPVALTSEKDIAAGKTAGGPVWSVLSSRTLDSGNEGLGLQV